MHFAPSQVIDIGVPILMEPLKRMLIFVQSGAIKACQAVGVGGKVGRHPVENDAQPCAMALINEVGKVGRLAEAGAGRKLAQRLITPGAAEGMLHNGQELNVGEPHI